MVNVIERDLQSLFFLFQRTVLWSTELEWTFVVCRLQRKGGSQPPKNYDGLIEAKNYAFALLFFNPQHT